MWNNGTLYKHYSRYDFGWKHANVHALYRAGLMSFCEIELYACFYFISQIRADCGWRWICSPIMSKSCSIEESYCDLTSQHNMSKLCRTWWLTSVVWGWALSCWKMTSGIVMKNWKHSRFNHQSNVQICCQDDCDRGENNMLL